MNSPARSLRLAAGALAGALLLATPEALAGQTFYTSSAAYGTVIAGANNGYIPFSGSGSWGWFPLQIGSVRFSNPAEYGSVEVSQFRPISPHDWALYASEGAYHPLLLTFAGPVYGIGFDFGGPGMGGTAGSLRLTVDGATAFTYAYASTAGPGFLGVTQHAAPLTSVLVERLDGEFTMYDNFYYTMDAPAPPLPPPTRVTATPEPATLALLGAGLVALVGVRRRRPV